MNQLKKISILFIAILLSFGCDGEKDIDCEYFNDCNGTGSNKTGKISVTIEGSSNLGGIQVYFNNVYQGDATGYYASTPPCDATGSLTVSVPVGQYMVTGTWGGNPLSTYSNVDVQANTCHIVQLSL